MRRKRSGMEADEDFLCLQDRRLLVIGGFSESCEGLQYSLV